MKIIFLTGKFKKYLLAGLAVTASFIVCVSIFLSLREDYKIMPAYYGSAVPSVQRTEGSKLAIIIDDFGQSRYGVKEMMSIQRHLTFAVMPFLENSEKDARDGYENGFEIIVHLAMEPMKGKASWLGPRPIMSGMDTEEVKKIVRESFETVPHASGANIHMGSKASAEEPIMSGVIEIMKDKNLYFVDSRTASNGIPKKVSDQKGVSCFERNVFLDGTKSVEYIKKQLKKAGDLAVKQGASVAIGHVGTEGGKETAQAINEMLPYFDQNNIKLVFVSELKDR